MDKKTGIIIGVIVLLFAGILGMSLFGQKRVQTVTAEEYSLDAVNAASEASGGLAENVEGDPNAPLLLFEYADYQCEGCAGMNPYLNELVEEYKGKIAVVYRGYVLSYHQNGTAAASAANAAALQGYWRPYKDLLFANQSEWYSANASQRQAYFEKYFTEATDGKGDLDKFREDMKSTEVAQKIAFDRALAERAGLDWTPSLWIGDELVPQKEMSMENLRTKIDAKLKEMEVK